MITRATEEDYAWRARRMSTFELRKERLRVSRSTVYASWLIAIDSELKNRKAK